MFEKEAEEYIDKLTREWTDGEYSFSVEELRQAILHFAEFGYNKANEWHYPSKGEYPKGKGAVLIYWKFGDVKCASVVEPYKVTEDKHIIAWKEIVLPELKEGCLHETEDKKKNDF